MAGNGNKERRVEPPQARQHEVLKVRSHHARRMDGASLLSTIEGEIIPRLMLAHSSAEALPACPETRGDPTLEEIAAMADASVKGELGTCLTMVESICREGLSLQSVLLNLLSPAARLLGDQWLADDRGFTEVSVGLGTLQQVVQVLGPSFSPSLARRGLVVLTAAPGEQHTLGLYLVGEFLRRAGWGVQIDPGLGLDELLDLVSSERVEMVGFTCSTARSLRALPVVIETCRLASMNPAVTVMVGGALEGRLYAEHVPGAVYMCDACAAVRWLSDYVSAEHA